MSEKSNEHISNKSLMVLIKVENVFCSFVFSFGCLKEADIIPKI